MTQRERNMLWIVLGLGGLVVGGGAFVGASRFLAGLNQKDTQIAALEQEVAASRARIAGLAQKQQKYERWRTISLPSNATVAKARYLGYLKEVAKRHQLNVTQLDESGGNRAATSRSSPLMNVLVYDLKAETSLPRLIGFLSEFYSTNLPHVIRRIDIVAPEGRGGETRLVVTLKIEALSLPTAANRDYLSAMPERTLLGIDVLTALKGGPSGLALGPWLFSPTGLHGSRKLASHQQPDRDYTRLITKNIFAGLAPPVGSVVEDKPKPDAKVLETIQLSGIVSNFYKTEAILRYYHEKERYLSLRDEPPFNSFEIKDDNNQVVMKGKVKVITDKCVVIMLDDKHYLLRLGQMLNQALAKEMTEEELKAYGVETVAGEGP